MDIKWCRFWLTIFLFLCLIQRCHSSLIQTLYTKHTEFSQKVATNIPRRCLEKTTTRTTCIVHCNLDESCVSVFYNKANGSCQLNFIGVALSDLIDSTGTIFYTRSGVDSTKPSNFVDRLSFHCSPLQNKAGADTECNKNGKRLAVTDTPDKLIALRDRMIDSAVADADYYLGATKDPSSQFFHWSNGVIIPSPNTSFWRRFEPGTLADEVCITIAPMYLNGLLNDDTCNGFKCYVCELI